ncbi:uncharacterized protein [Diabrotica undecimpunctata]|uniref:uncharacterized protein n=1 Tax=Diabrotica undecimpunctata TaxID=50387 RepID=UPI003B63FA2B
MVLDYNKSKSAVDMSDQMTTYSSPLGKTVKWYKKLAIELLLNTAILNVSTMYIKTTKNCMPIVDFRKALVEYLTNSRKENESEGRMSRPTRIKHELGTKPGKVRDSRSHWVQCYKLNVVQVGRKLAKNKTKR